MPLLSFVSCGFFFYSIGNFFPFTIMINKPYFNQMMLVLFKKKLVAKVRPHVEKSLPNKYLLCYQPFHDVTFKN